jgi:hypothetical protein
MNSVDWTVVENLVFRYVDTSQYDAFGTLFADAKVTTNKADQVFMGENAVPDAWRMSNTLTHHRAKNRILSLTAWQRGATSKSLTRLAACGQCL